MMPCKDFERGAAATFSEVPVPHPTGSPKQPDCGLGWKANSVVYIEDDAVDVALMEHVFGTQSQWRLHCATNGASGIAAALQQHPRVILLDMNLPDMTGIEVFRRLKTDPRTSQIPCVAVSADAMSTSIYRVRAMGFEDYWTKPLDLAVTVGKLKRLLA